MNHLYKYDGNIFTKIPKPSEINFFGYDGQPYSYNNKLYLRYRNDSSVFQLCEYDENTLTPVTNPANHNIPGSGYSGQPYNYKDALYLSFVNNNNISQLYRLTTNTSIDDLTTQNINIFPNPNNGTFKVAANMEANSIVQLQLYSVLGELVYSEEVATIGNKLDAEISVQNIASGIYMLQFVADNKTYCKRLVVE
jgi:hypothetical protein